MIDAIRRSMAEQEAQGLIRYSLTRTEIWFLINEAAEVNSLRVRHREMQAGFYRIQSRCAALAADLDRIDKPNLSRIVMELGMQASAMMTEETQTLMEVLRSLNSENAMLRDVIAGYEARA